MEQDDRRMRGIAGDRDVEFDAGGERDALQRGVVIGGSPWFLWSWVLMVFFASDHVPPRRPGHYIGLAPSR